MNGWRRLLSRDPIERYLGRLALWAPRHCRRDLVAESARHLFDATQLGIDVGQSRAVARRRALAAFGPAWRVGLAARGIVVTGLSLRARGRRKAARSPRMSGVIRGGRGARAARLAGLVRRLRGRRPHPRIYH